MGEAMRVKVTAPFIELAKGTVLAGLDADQIKRRRLSLKDLGNGRQELTGPTHFKKGESFDMEELPKNLREFLSVESEAPLPEDLEGMTRVALVELAESRGIRIAANASKPDIIAAIEGRGPTAVPDKEADAPPLPENLDEMSRDELVEVAEKIGVSVANRDTKHDIIKAIRKQQRKVA
jgi:hypothetical protein